MKKIFIVAVAMLLTFTAFAQDGRSIYNKYSDAKGVSAVYVSPAMFRLIKHIPQLEVEGVDISPLIKSLDGLYVIDSENDSINKSIANDAEKFVKSGSYELLMEVKDDGEVVHMYTAGKKDIINSFVLITSEPGECTFICFTGEINRNDLEKAIGAIAQEAM